jgi:hypothetical protein
MKKILFVFILGVVASCSFKTNEEKARALIEPKIKLNLMIPDSYEFLQVALDSCFSETSNLILT